MLADEFFPMAEMPELFMLFRIMVTTSSARTLIKNLAAFASDIELLIRTRPNQPTTEQLFYPFFGEFIRLQKTFW